MKSDLNRELQLKTSELRASKVNRHDFEKLKRNEIYVILDRVDNGYNLGAILRLCDVTLVKKLYIIEGKNTIARKALKAAKGAENWVPYEVVIAPAELINKLKQDGVIIASLEICHDSVDYRKVDFSKKPICFVFGSETSGVSEEILNLSDMRIHLPVQGMCNSLNVSSCAAVILYEAIKSQMP